MESFYLIVVIVLVALAVSDLVVGVSNDAVNFLNSAVGAKAASRKVILIIASLGILVGATFSSGLMEVARKGIFHPDQFIFSEIMIIFLAVMIADIILLDFFNTFGLPTSTTVSIIFELLGAAVAISIIKLNNAGESLMDLGKYINSEKAIAIILGILLSIFIAFIIGMIIQYLTRLLFTFNYKKNLKYFGSIWGGIAITAITYFILIKGAKGSSFITDESLAWIKSHTLIIILISFAGWTIGLQILNWLFRLNIPRIIVLVGTFALAMAFAGNDLVNFIGVPLAGLSSYREFAETGNDHFLMTSLTAPVKTNTFLLLLAGIIMIMTLWLSKKARTVTRTEVNLARQEEGEERFGSSILSRSLVRIALNLDHTIKSIIPESIRKRVNSRFKNVSNNHIHQKEQSAFDLIRASTNLTLASILIAFATSLKLPLSTTYVMFMVAMGTSLSDRAWGRESAVYRITGVFTVIGGWFLTALTAFTLAAIFAILIYYTSFVGITILIVIAAIFIIRTYIIFRKKESKKEEIESIFQDVVLNDANVVEQCSSTIAETLMEVPKTFHATIIGLANEDLKKLKNTYKDITKLNKKSKYLKDNIHLTIEKLHEDSIESGHYFVQAVDYLREIAHCLNFISLSAYNHVDNNHKRLIPDQVDDLNNIYEGIYQLYKNILEMINAQKFTEVDHIIREQQELLNMIENMNKQQIKRIKNREAGTKNSLLFLGILAETKNMLLYTINLVKSQRDFIKHLQNPETTVT
jgi:phosphate/sulfate permease